MLLKGKPIKNDLLRKILLPSEFKDGISTAINSQYNKKSYNFIKAFLYKNDELYLNPQIIEELQEQKALKLYEEHINLFEYLSINKTYVMKTFDLIDKGEFLFNVASKDCYMNVVGEKIDRQKKSVYCTIKITEKKSFYDNHIVDNDKVIYYTQGSQTKEKAIEKVETFKNENYKFYICAQFPHLGYSSTAYFDLGNVKISSISEVKITDKGRFNHEIEFQLEKEIPMELLQYKN